MSNIYLSFEHKDRSSPHDWEIYTNSLLEQFELIRTKLPKMYRNYTFDNFIMVYLMPGVSSKFRLSHPDFNVEKIDDAKFINNVVVRPEVTSARKRLLPDNQDLIFICDIQLKSERPYHFTVKAMEFIDHDMTGNNDIIISAYPNVKMSYGREANFIPNNLSESDNVLTPDLIYDLVKKCSVVENRGKVIDYLSSWDNYLEFRKYYIAEQRKKMVYVKEAKLISEAYLIDRKNYKKHSFEYEDYLLDNQEAFAHGGQIVLSKNVKDSERFPLMRVYVQLRKKEYLKFDKVTRDGRKINEFESKLFALIRENVYLSRKVTLNLNNDEYINDLKNGISIDERYKVVHYDVAPKIQLEDNEQRKNNELKDIEEACRKNYLAKAENLAREDKALIDDFDKDFSKDSQKALEKALISVKKQLKNEGSSLYYNLYNHALTYAQTMNDVENFDNYFEGAQEAYVEDFSSNFKKEYIDKHYQDRYKTFIKQITNLKFKDLESEMQLEILKQQQDCKEKYAQYEKEIRRDFTDIRYVIYFKVPENLYEHLKNKGDKATEGIKALRYDDRAESAKLNRQRRGLKSFSQGYVKNPYLASYLFEPEKLPPITYKSEDWTWFSKHLNDKQQEAVMKAVSSNGLSLLQGPPGTGKTEVIAETVAHLVLKGKKVLISSETHKAIDNVFERLPKIADIVPVRLIANGRKDNEYSPDRLVNNFYNNISSSMTALVKKYENFKELKEQFNEEYEKLVYLNNKVKKAKKNLESQNEEVIKLQKEIKKINSEIEVKKEVIDDYNMQVDAFKRTRKAIKANLLTNNSLEESEKKILGDYYTELKKLFDIPYFQSLTMETMLSNLESITQAEVRNELTLLTNDPSGILNIQIDQLKSQMAEHMLDEDQTLFIQLRGLFLELKKKQPEKILDIDEFKIPKIFVYASIATIADDIPELILEKRHEVAELKSKYDEIIDREISKIDSSKYNTSQEINKLRESNNALQEKIRDIKDSDDYVTYESDNRDLKVRVEKFFKDFEIHAEYENIDGALTIIADEWEKLETDFIETERQNKLKIPAYKKIAAYLSDENVIENDKELYTHDLFNHANVFGLTCTSSDRFSKERMDDFTKYNIDDVNIKNLGIDVAIIDEVSKSSFLDLLIPILYGKTVILVGDHRQLPPMYDLGRMRRSDFDELNPEIIDFDINKRYKELYETSFFKTLFENIKPDYKTMLTKQYRCHEQIMHVFNHFYQNKLELGYPTLNTKKEHYLNIWENGINVIRPEKHTYFIDCKRHEARDSDSTSFFNENEALVATKLIKDIAEYLEKNPMTPKLSLGVITTYSDQARKIRDLVKKNVKASTFNIPGEKFVISTVDDFQGDERDIIILSMVRNPEKGAKSDPEFINAYQRINVAMSRARKMLIILGSREYLSEKGVIDLPDIDGNHALDNKSFQVYKEIIATIDNEGLLLNDIDILDKKDGE